MNKEEKAIADSIAQILFEAIGKLTEAVALNAAATRYLADSIAAKAEVFPMDTKGHEKVKFSLTTSAKEESTEEKVTFESLRAAVNRFAADEGKEKTLELVRVYAPSGSLKDVAESDYSDLLASVL